MSTYRITEIGIVDQFTDTTYQSAANGETATANGEDDQTISELHCKCSSVPPLTAKGNSGRPKYTITGVNPSGRRIVLTMRCTRVPQPFTPDSTICTFKDF